jgi:hypothetical protein
VVLISVRRRSKELALLAIAVVGAVAALAIYSFTEQESSTRKIGTASSIPAGHRPVVRWVRTGRSYRIRRSCGFIQARGKRIAVDIAEGRLPMTCSAARAVMSRYLAGSLASYGTLRYGIRRFDCYKSRPDGEGWDYNCLYSKYRAADAYVDIGAGRRPYR